MAQVCLRNRLNGQRQELDDHARKAVKKAAGALNKLYDIQDPVFVSETAPQEKIEKALADCDLVVGTWLEDADHNVRRAWTRSNCK